MSYLLIDFSKGQVRSSPICRSARSATIAFHVVGCGGEPYDLLAYIIYCKSHTPYLLPALGMYGLILSPAQQRLIAAQLEIYLVVCRR